MPLLDRKNASVLGKRTSQREEVRLVPATHSSERERVRNWHILPPHDLTLHTNLHKRLIFLVHLLNKILNILGKSFFLLTIHAGNIDWLAEFKDSVSLFKEWKVIF